VSQVFVCYIECMWFFVDRNLVIDGYQVSVMNKVVQVGELGRLQVITLVIRM
jgi:hypothetical protein